MSGPATPIAYDTLRLIWWALLGILLTGFAVLDGYDLGTAILLPFAGREDAERRQIRETIEPNWEGHQVWLVVGGGAAFAAWPLLYAAAFSSFYLAMFLVLVALILRPVDFNFRDKLPGPGWRGFWDWGLAASGFVSALVFGIAFGNLLLGVPFAFDDDLRASYGGGFIELLSPFGVLCGLVSVAMLTMHGGTWLAQKTDGPVAKRAGRIARVAGFAAAVLFALAGWWVATRLDGYVLGGTVSRIGPSSPLGQSVTRATGAWLGNFRAIPWLAAAPALGLAGTLLVAAIPAHRARKTVFLAGAIGIAGIIATAGIALFPFLMPSSTSPASSLTVWNASSSPPTLWAMLIATAIFLPIIIAYTAYVLRVVRGRVRLADVIRHDSLY